MTIQDVLNECAVFEHSKEHFEMLRECSEIALLEQYIADQEFMLESAEEIASFKESGFFAEAATADKLAEYKEGVAEKGKNLLTKIIGGIKKLVNMITTFFVKLYGKVKEFFFGKEAEKQAANIEAIRKFAAEKAFSEDQAKKIGEVIAANKVASLKFKKVKKAAKFEGAVDDKVQTAVSIVLAQKCEALVANTDFKNAVDIDVLASVASVDRIESEKESADKIKKLKASANNSVLFKVDDADLTAKIDNLKLWNESWKKKAEGDVSVDGKDAATYKAEVEAYKELSSTVPDTIAVYGALANFYMQMTKALGLMVA